MCVLVKTGALIVLPTIHTENKTKKILGTIWGRKLDSKFSKVLWCFYKLEIHKVSRFVKSHDWNLKFSSWLSQVSQIVLFKNEEKDWKERKKMKKKKKKKCKKSQTMIVNIFTFPLCIWTKNYFVWKYCLEKPSLYHNICGIGFYRLHDIGSSLMKHQGPHRFTLIL